MATGKMNKHGNLRCEGCESYDLEVSVPYDGMAEHSVAGRVSGFEHVVELKHPAHVSMIREERA